MHFKKFVELAIASEWIKHLSIIKILIQIRRVMSDKVCIKSVMLLSCPVKLVSFVGNVLEYFICVKHL